MAIDKQRVGDLEQKMIKTKNAMGMIGGTVRFRALKGLRPNIMGGIDPKTWDAEIKMNKDWKPESVPGVSEYIKKKNISDPVECAVTDVTGHEVEHWKHCPYDLDHHLEVYEAMADVFKTAGRDPYVQVKDENGKMKQDYGPDIRYMANAFEDIVVNANRRAAGSNGGDGITIFFRDQQIFTPFYEAFVRTNMKVWGDSIDSELVKRSYLPTKKFLFFKSKANAEVEKCVSNVVNAFGCTSNPERNLDILNNKDNWERLAADFAKHMLPIYDKPPYQNQGQGQQGQGSGQGQSQQGQGQSQQQKQEQKEEQPQQEKKDQGGQGKDEKEQEKEEKKDEKKEGKGKGKDDKKEEKEENKDNEGQGKGDQKKEDEKKKGKGSGQGEDDKDKEESQEDGEDDQSQDQGGSGDKSKPWDGKHPPTSPGDNPFDKMMKDEDEMRKAVTRRIQQAVGSGKKGGKAGLPPNVEPLMYLDVLYEMIAPDIKIQIKSREGNGFSYPVIPYGKEAFDPERHNLTQLRTNKMVLNGDKELVFAAIKHKYPVDIPIVEGERRLPDMSFLIDSSGSMVPCNVPAVIRKMAGMKLGDTSQIPWGDQSGYHFALLGAYGIMKWLKFMNIAPYIKFSAINFSDATWASKEASFSELNEFKKMILSPQSGGTEIDIKVIEQQLGSKDQSVVIMLSDGEIYNWTSIRKRFLAIMSRHIPVFIQIGGETQTGKDFAKMGFAVYTVRKYEDLAGLMIDAAAKAFSGDGTGAAGIEETGEDEDKDSQGTLLNKYKYRLWGSKL